MKYEPRRDEMTADERRFLDLIAPTGLDWLTTRADFARRQGVTDYYGFAKVISLQPSGVLSETPLTWHMYAWEHAMDLPPEYLFASFMPYTDARKNHREIERELGARLGRPVKDDTGNCIVRRWTFGVFAVELHTFPPEKQDPRLPNLLHQAEPRFITASSLSIKTDYAHVHPDGSLDPIAEAIRRSPDRHDTISLLHLPEVDRYSRAPASIRHSRRNPRSLDEQLGRASSVAWIESDGRFGLSSRTRTLVFERTPPAALVLDRVQPARGPGGSWLEFQTRPPVEFDDERKLRARLTSGDRMDSLDATADRLARFWNLPLVFESSFDD